MASNGTITSPNYPSNYENGAECSWVINVVEGSSVQLTFETFELESSTGCRYDYIEFRDGSSTSPSIGKYCGSTTPSPILSSGRSLFVKFHSDGSRTMKGFKAKFITVATPTNPPLGKNVIKNEYITITL
mgnify:CR=1 FL=1